MIESMYQSNAGNLRRSWLTLRRAMLIAQMMGLYRGELSPSLVMLDPGTRNRINPEHMWFRIVQSDRYLSLMLGLPQGSIDDSFATPMALDGCTGREVMERIESVAAGRILQRNHTDILDLDATRDIDKLLREASSSMPAQWWLNPDFISTANDEGVALRETVRIMDHFVHYNLLAHLHLPYMLHFSADEKYDYSKIMAVNASRELLMRFVSFHKFNKSHIHCRGIDFFAFIASTTLCLAHIDSHHRRRDGMDADSRVVFAFLAHQRLGDRGLMERALETMQQMASRDIVTSRIGHILRHLLAIEADAEDGGIYCTSSTSEESKEELECGEVSDSGNVLRIYVPYFGTVKVERSGVSKTVSRMPEASSLGLPDSRGMSRLTPHQQGGYNKLLSTENLRACEAAGTQPVNADFHAISSDIDRLLPSPGSAPTAENHGFLHDFHVSGAENSQQLLGPELVASVDDWALQGVDIALFDSLIRGSDSDS
ncbi:Fc.00g057070.m01.CDS01 [Cosmosporella sp. VM-42]